MPKLKDVDCRNATCPPELKRRRLSDGAGLYLEVAPGGSKRWFWKFYPEGKESRLALGSYPEVSLSKARLDRDAARRTRKSGTNPVQQRKADKAERAASSAKTYESAAREFHATKASEWSEGHGTKWLRMNELYLFPGIGALALADIKAKTLLAALRKVEAKGILSTAHDLLSMAGQVFRYGVQTGICEHNPVGDLRGALKPHTAKHFAAILEPAKAGELLRAIDGYTGQPETAAALKLASLFFQRPGNIRAMEWNWVDLDDALVSIPAVKMKAKKAEKLNGRPHLVPLAKQALVILRAMHPLTGHGRYVFPSARGGDRPMSDGTLNAALKRMDFGSDDHVGHGFRAMARTMMAERLVGIPADLVEAQLGHVKGGPLRGAYDRAEYIDQRRQVMQTWADYLDQLRTGGQVIALPKPPAQQAPAKRVA